MEAPKMQVNCGVKDCHHNKENKCHAGNLEVNPMGDNKVETSGGTQCSTFTQNSEM